MGKWVINTQVVKTKDGSNTLFSKSYKQHYHNVNDGAIKESLSKHIIPCLEFHKGKDELNILDICFGLGYNTFATIIYAKKYKMNLKLNFFSPELDEKLISSLCDFTYPKEFDSIKHIIKSISKDFEYEDEFLTIQLKIVDARKYIQSFNMDFFHIVYQDAFSSEVNPELWTKEYFNDIYKILKQDSILSTYSIATPVRLSLYEAKFFIYEYIPIKRKSTLCFKLKQEEIGRYIDMELKKTRNPKAQALYDKNHY